MCSQITSSSHVRTLFSPALVFTHRRLSAGDARFGGPIWWNTPLREDDGDAQEEDYRTQWEQDGAAVDPASAHDPLQAPVDQSGGGGGGGAKRGREGAAADEEAELPAEVQARLKALRGD